MSAGKTRALWRLAGGLLLAGVLVALASWWTSQPQPTAQMQILKIRTGLGATSAEQNIEQLDQGVRLLEGRAETVADQWVGWEGAAFAYLSRARFTGSYDDFVAAGNAINKGFAVADKPFGPWEAKAQWAMAVHRLNEAEKALNVVKGYAIRSDGEKASTLSLFGDLALYRGKYDEALAEYNRAAELSPGTGSALRIANLQNKLGRPDDALRTIDEAMAVARKPSPSFLAFVLAQSATIMLEHGRWDDIGPYLTRAEEVFPGWWLVGAMQAQSLVLQGKVDQAINAYEQVAENSGQPEVMDALAALLRSEGRIAESGKWSGRAGEIWQKRLGLLPKAAYAHAFDHEVYFGSPARALEYARRNAEARPFGESYVLLASALVNVGKPKEALSMLDRVDRSGWKSARQYLLRAEVLQMLGRADEAEEAMLMARTINPRIDDPRAIYIWFGHG